MDTVYLSITLSLLAGLSTLIGFLIVIIFNRRTTSLTSIAFILGISSSIILYLSLFELLVESNIYFNNVYNKHQSLVSTLIFISVGLISGLLIEKSVPKKEDTGNSLTRLGTFTAIALAFHNIPEGMITFFTSMNDTKLGILITLTILAHNIPEGIIISLPISMENGSKKKAFLYTFFSGFCEMVGAFICFIFFKNSFNDLVIASLLSIVSGIMIIISSKELFPAAFKLSKKESILGLITGFVIMSILLNII